jgi:hypothetical protein
VGIVYFTVGRYEGAKVFEKTKFEDMEMDEIKDSQDVLSEEEKSLLKNLDMQS